MQHGRNTFLKGRELIARAVDYSSQVLAHLDSQSAESSTTRVGMLLDSFTSEQRALKDNLERYAIDASDEVLDTYVQYSIALPDPLPEPERALSPEEATRWLLEVKANLETFFSEVAEKAEPGEMREAFANLAESVRASDIRISKESNRMQDL